MPHCLSPFARSLATHRTFRSVISINITQLHNETETHNDTNTDDDDSTTREPPPPHHQTARRRPGVIWCVAGVETVCFRALLSLLLGLGCGWCAVVALLQSWWSIIFD